MQLGYWNIRGLAHAIRVLLAATETPYDDVFYDTVEILKDQVDGSDSSKVSITYDRSGWTRVKETFGFDFPNLPYLIDGEVKITESMAILRYLGRKTGWCPKTEKEQIDCDVLEGVVMEVKNAFSKLSYSPDFEKLRPDFVATLPVFFTRLEAKLGENDFFVGGDRPVHVDALICEVLDQLLALEPSCLDSFGGLQAFHARVRALPGVADLPKLPINNKMARFGGKLL